MTPSIELQLKANLESQIAKTVERSSWASPTSQIREVTSVSVLKFVCYVPIGTCVHIQPPTVHPAVTRCQALRRRNILVVLSVDPFYFPRF